MLLLLRASAPFWAEMLLLLGASAHLGAELRRRSLQKHQNAKVVKILQEPIRAGAVSSPQTPLDQYHLQLATGNSYDS